MSTEAPEALAVGDYPDAGIHIDYYESPYRRYVLNDIEVPSVTTVLGIKATHLEGWIEKMTLEGVWHLMTHPGEYQMPRQRRPLVCPHRAAAKAHGKRPPGWAYHCKVPADDCFSHDPRLCQFRIDLKERGLTADAARDHAAERGVDVHKVWEEWNVHRKVPDVSIYPPDRHGYIRSMSDFIIAHKPKCIEAEAVVGSKTHGFAGRLDTVVVLQFDGEPCMVDVKTSKSVYPDKHFPQLAGYEIARRECGLVHTKRHFILRLDKDGGKAELAESDGTGDDFLALLNAWKSQRKWSERRRKAKKA